MEQKTLKQKGRIPSILGLILLLTSSVSANGPMPGAYTIAFIVVFLLNALIELVAALVYALLTRIPAKQTLPPAFYANIISYPIFLLALGVVIILTPPDSTIFWAIVILFEALVVLFEARLMEKMNPALKKPLHLSLLMNATSFLIFTKLFW